MENSKAVMCERVNMDDYIQFQIVEWVDLDNNGKYTVLIFGRDGEGKSVTLQVNDYKPFYYIKPNSQKQIKNIEKKLQKIILKQGSTKSRTSRVKEEYGDEEEVEEEEIKDLFEYKIEKKKDFYYFNNGREEKYFKIVVKSKREKYGSQKEIEKLNKNQKDEGKKIKFYEINGDPYIKLIHERNINPAGWIRVQKDKLRKFRSTDIKTSTTQNYVIKSYEDIERSDLMEIAPIKISAFDLECRPIKGRGFPKASKGYTIGQDIYDRYFTNMNVQNFDNVGWFIIRKLQEHGLEKLPEEVYRDSVRDKIIDNLRKKYNVHKKKYKEADDFRKVELREDYIQQISALLIQQKEYWSKNFKGDPIIQIGLTTSVLGQDIGKTHKCIFTLKKCKIKEEDGKDVDIRECKTEGELIEKFCEEMDKIDPDIITGYNTSGFDNQYLYHRAQELQKTDALKKMSRLSDLDWGDDELEDLDQKENPKYQKYFVKYKITKLSSSALGKNDLKYIQTYGRVQMDLYKKIQRDENFESYKLDYVANQLIGEKKNDLKPEEIFDYFEEGNKYQIGMIAKYCVQDCVLCNKIIFKKDIITKEIAMANVCTVPLSYIFHRGQGVKIYSLVLKQTTLKGFVIEDRRNQINEYQTKKQQAQQKEEEKKEKEKAKKEKEKEKKKKQGETQEETQEEEEEQSEKSDEEDEETFCGATVLEPKTGIYSNQMISVFDYASLYPSSMIEYNVSHDTLIREGEKLEFPEEYYTKPVNVNFNGEEEQDEETMERKQETYRFIKSEHYQGIIPQILQGLLQQRKKVRKLIPQEPDSGKRKILDSQQLAYKITANSIYGQCGASTSQISLQPLAKVTTAVGRQMLQKAINFFQYSYKSQVIYGDTDSCFIILNEKAYFEKIDQNNPNKIQAKLKALFEKGKEIEEEFQKLISDKQKLEFEKILYPVILFAKKRYYGYKHESGKKKELITTGTIAKRRDSCNITKEMYGKTLDILMGQRGNGEEDLYKQSIDYIQDQIRRVKEGEYDKSYFKFTKTYKGDNEYKSDNLPHVQVVRKMQKEGKVVEPSERIEYYIARRDAEENQSKLPQYQKAVSAEDLEKMIDRHEGGIDYINYIEKQIKNPLIQIYSLNVEKLIQRIPQDYITLLQYEKIREEVKKTKYADNEKNKKNLSEGEIQQKIEDRMQDINESIVKKLIFNEVVPQLVEPGMIELKRLKKQDSEGKSDKGQTMDGEEKQKRPRGSKKESKAEASKEESTEKKRRGAKKTLEGTSKVASKEGSKERKKKSTKKMGEEQSNKV